MRKKYLFVAAAAAMLSACSSNDALESVQNPGTVETPAVEKGAVSFEAYAKRSVSRSGDPGVMDLDRLKDTSFGVFGYYTDNNEYDGLTIPNFFYNQEIKWNDQVADQWSYSPLKYWPNEFGSSAISDDVDKVSFFAYAPYINVSPSNGKAVDTTYGITQISKNTNSGDPYVKYIGSFEWEKSVDLLWGVVANDQTDWNIIQGASQKLTPGLPWIDIQRPTEAATHEAAQQRVKFQFEHALAQLNVVIDYDADQTDHSDNVNELETATRVYVRSISFGGFSMKGALNLNNPERNKPYWLGYDAASDIELGEEITVYDGRKDGREGASGSQASNEKNSFLNPSLIQTTTWASDNKGVLNKPQNIFRFPGADLVAQDMRTTQSGSITLDDDMASALGETAGAYEYDGSEAMLNWPVMVIPTGEEMKVTIVYDVETVDKNLATTLGDGMTAGSSIENRITKNITFSGDKNYLEAGKKYTIKLHLGLNSVKFDAAVSEWDDTAVEGEAWLPSNKTSYQAQGVYNYSVLAGATANQAFELTGFANGETVAVTLGEGVTGGSSAPYTTTNGTVSIAANEFTFAANTKLVDVTTANAIKFTGTSSGKEVIINLVQLAAEVDATQSSITGSGSTLTFALKDAHGTALTGATWTGDARNVTIVSATRNGVAMTELDESATPSKALDFKCSDDNEITLGTDVATGEVFVFTIKAGDASEFTLTKTID